MVELAVGFITPKGDFGKHILRVLVRRRDLAALVAVANMKVRAELMTAL